MTGLAVVVAIGTMLLASPAAALVVYRIGIGHWPWQSCSTCRRRH